MGVIRTVIEKQEQLNGMALGGLGTGSVEISQNGSLENWQIFNRGKWACIEPEKYQKEDLPDYEYDVLPFYIRTRQGEGEPVVRKLCHNRRIEGFRSVSYSFMKNIETIKWTPNFPVCHMGYEDPALPVSLEAEFASPFVPHDEKTSGMPGFYVNFTVANKSESDTEISLLGTLKNPINRGCACRMLRNGIRREGNRTTLYMGSRSQEKNEQNGSIALSVAGGDHSYIVGDYAGFFGAYVLTGDYGISEESCLFGFRDCGALPDQGWEEKDETFLRLDKEKLWALTEEETDKMMESAKKLASGFRPWKRLKEIRPDLLESLEGRKKFLEILLEQYREFEGKVSGDFGDGALCSKFVLRPGESKEIRFLVTWNFPNHISIEDNYVGHKYSCWCADAEDAAKYLIENGDEIMRKVRHFSKLLQTCSAPEEFTRNWILQLNTLVKCSWWAENGEFGMWEGLGSCGFHTMDITYYGSFMILALFPGLQLRQMRMGIKFQREDGRVHHCFCPDFEHVDNGYDRVDMNPQFVLMVCRDYLWTGDREYLEAMWIPVIRAMDSIEKLDQDGDGLPDSGTEANTYDAWKLRGIPVYIAGLWLASLTAAVRLAREMKDSERQAHWQQMLDKGKDSLKKLWNGEYFDLWVDGQDRDGCLMTGQLDAAWYCKLTGLSAYVEDNVICKVLDKVWDHNYSKESGLINASYPEGKTATLYTYENVQVESNWSGIEYAVSSMLLEMGYFEKARELAGNVEERYVYAGRIFNHEECGGHYYRPLAAWVLMLSLAGLKLDVPEQTIAFEPKQTEMEVPWFTPSGCGTIRNNKNKLEIGCQEGCLDVKNVKVWDGFRVKTISISGTMVKFIQEDEIIKLEEIHTLWEGDMIALEGFLV